MRKRIVISGSDEKELQKRVDELHKRGYLELWRNEIRLEFYVRIYITMEKGVEQAERIQ